MAPASARAFEGFLNGGAVDTDVRDWAVRFSRTNVVSNFLPLLMAARLRLPPDQFLEILDLCEKMAFRTYILKGARSHAGAQKLNRLSSLVYKSENFDTVIYKLTLDALSTCDNEGMRNAFRPNAVRREWYTWKGLKYFLYEYEEARQLAEPLKPIVPWSEVGTHTIEHVSMSRTSGTTLPP